MIPFIRQWGHECEVLEPEHLRATIAEHARKMAELYDNVTRKEEDK
jgi:predicted DNA-binding transcriptional regulator YafY